MQAYFQPKLPKVENSELPDWRGRRPVALDVEYKINGVPDPKHARKAQGKIAAAIERTKLFDVRSSATDRFILTVAEEYDEKDVYAKAKAAGETFGAAGSITESKLSFDGRMERAGRTVFSKSSSVTMKVVLGNRSVPDDYEAIGLLSADRALVDSNVRAFLRDAWMAGALED